MRWIWDLYWIYTRHLDQSWLGICATLALGAGSYILLFRKKKMMLGFCCFALTFALVSSESRFITIYPPIEGEMLDDSDNTPIAAATLSRFTPRWTFSIFELKNFHNIENVESSVVGLNGHFYFKAQYFFGIPIIFHMEPTHGSDSIHFQSPRFHDQGFLVHSNLPVKFRAKPLFRNLKNIWNEKGDPSEERYFLERYLSELIHRYTGHKEFYSEIEKICVLFKSYSVHLRKIGWDKNLDKRLEDLCLMTKDLSYLAH